MTGPTDRDAKNLACTLPLSSGPSKRLCVVVLVYAFFVYGNKMTYKLSENF